MDAQHLFAGHGEHAEGIVVAQILLGRHGEARQVRELAQVVRMHTRRVKGLAVMGHIVIGVPERPFQPFKLQCLQLVAAGVFDGVAPGVSGLLCC
jgi:hypothetical protein